MRFRLSTACVIFVTGAACGTGGAGRGSPFNPTSSDEGPFGANSNTSGPFGDQSGGVSGPFGVTPSGGGTTPGGGTTAASVAQTCLTWCNQANPSQCAGSSSSGTKPSNFKLPTSCSDLCAMSSSSASCTTEEQAVATCIQGAETPCYGGSMYIVGCDSQLAAVSACEGGSTGAGGSSGLGGSFGTGGFKSTGGSFGTGGYTTVGTGGSIGTGGRSGTGGYSLGTGGY